MFARTVSVHLKPGLAGEFTRLHAQDVMPILRRQQGFLDEISLVAANRTQAIGISLWELRENAEAYARTDYSDVVKALEHVVQGTPLVQLYEVSSSTLHDIPVRAF
jgi:hypothetical protein